MIRHYQPPTIQTQSGGNYLFQPERTLPSPFIVAGGSFGNIPAPQKGVRLSNDDLSPTMHTDIEGYDPSGVLFLRRLAHELMGVKGAYVVGSEAIEEISRVSSWLLRADDAGETVPPLTEYQRNAHSMLAKLGMQSFVTTYDMVGQH